MISLDDFKPITLDDYELITKHYEKYPPIHSDNVFTTMISWKDYGNYNFAFYKKNLVIFTEIDNNIRFRAPIGKYDNQIFLEIMKLAKTIESEYPFGFITGETKNWFSKEFPLIEIMPHRDYYDYVYLTSDLANLSGGDFRKIRNRLNKFVANHEYKIEAISENNIKEVKRFLKRWCLWRDCDSIPLLEKEKKAVFYSINHFDELNLSGILLLINDRIEAVAVFEKMDPDTVVVHYEKGSPYYDGIYKAINFETANFVKNEVTFINREPDMGVPGLRRAKTSYRPHHFVEVSHAARENLP